jgi:hypothetical protein
VANADGVHQGANIGFAQFHPSATLQPARQHHGAVADTNQATNCMANGFEHASDFAVSSFRNGYTVPTVCTLAAAVFNRAKLRHAIVQLHTIEQFLLFFFVELS